jgi:hypothetical protein
MGGHPIKKNSDIGLMKSVDKEHEILRRTVTACRSKKTCYLIPPGAIKRVLHQRHNLYGRKSHFFHITGQLFCYFPIGKELSFFSHPGT